MDDTIDGTSGPETAVNRPYGVMVEITRAGEAWTEWEESEGLERIAKNVIEDKLPDLLSLSIRYFWKEKGGSSGGNAKLGQCQKPSGLLSHFSGCDFIIWIAADHAAGYGFGEREIEAALFHELLHIDLGTDESGPRLRPHLFEGFAEEVEEYGFWTQSLKEISRSFKRQLELELAPVGRVVTLKRRSEQAEAAQG